MDISGSHSVLRKHNSRERICRFFWSGKNSSRGPCRYEVSPRVQIIIIRLCTLLYSASFSPAGVILIAHQQSAGKPTLRTMVQLDEYEPSIMTTLIWLIETSCSTSCHVSCQFELLSFEVCHMSYARTSSKISTRRHNQIKIKFKNLYFSSTKSILN